MIKSTPTAYQLSDWDSMTEIFYKCSNCGCDFRLFGDKEKFCHNCGQKQNWTYLPKYCKKSFSDTYHKLKYADRVSAMEEFDKALKFEVLSMRGEIE